MQCWVCCCEYNRTCQLRGSIEALRCAVQTAETVSGGRGQSMEVARQQLVDWKMFPFCNELHDYVSDGDVGERKGCLGTANSD